MIKIDNLSPFALTGDQGVRSQGEIICIFPVTSHQSPVTSHQSPVTSHQSPVTCHQSPVTCHQSPVT
ncbi:hypothetical protein [Sphaerospermopsis reniformis]|uniref:hypothetical protein n=1 Tax=Sphaerospermopsis reniformis TaxID=531300 RepID=UPI0013968D6A|nr:hypothetical protein [Sphaerospermopsis reniformis]